MTGTMLVWIVSATALLLLGLVLFSIRATRRAEARVPPLGSFHDTDGARLHVVDRGSGPPVVLIHGLNGTVRNFTYAVSERLTESFRVVALDRPGAGHSRRMSGARPGPRGDAEQVATLMRDLGLERAVLVGHSLGGAVALATAVAHPGLVAGLALVAPLTQSQDAPPGVFRALRIGSRPIRHLLAWTLAAPATIVARQAALKTIFAPEPVPPDFGTRGGGHLAARPGQFFEASADLVAVAEDLPLIREGYGSLDVPVGILYGRGDRILDPRLHGEEMRDRIADLRLDLVEGGHMLPVTQPDRVAAFVREVAARAWGRAGDRTSG